MHNIMHMALVFSTVDWCIGQQSTEPSWTLLRSQPCECHAMQAQWDSLLYLGPHSEAMHVEDSIWFAQFNMHEMFPNLVSQMYQYTRQLPVFL